MDTNKIFSKFNMKNYNDELEEILETKIFSSDVKNLLLSMLYKIENAYKDYQTVKVEVLPQKDLINTVIKMIKEKCEEIEFISSDSNQKPKVDIKKGSILCYPNETALLSAVLYMGEETAMMSYPYTYVKQGMQEMLTIGTNINLVEVMRDFNGWSWDSNIREIENIKYNIIYQSLLLIEGKKLIEANIKGNRVSQNKKEKSFQKLFNTICSATMSAYIADNQEAHAKIQKIRKEKINRLELFENKKEFVGNMASEKKSYEKKIEQADKIINNAELLKEEYSKRNALLPNKEKIFSISHLADKLEKERREYLENIRRCNKLLDPKEFVVEKEKIQQEVNFLNKIEADKIENNIVECCKYTLECAKQQIKKVEEKSELIEWIYKIRYYRHIPFNNELYLKDIDILEEEFKEVIQLLTKKAQENKIWDTFSEDDELTYIVIRELFDCKMINLENVNMSCQYEKGILYIEYYDTNVLETKAEFKREKVRIKKKIKLFI